MPISDWSKAQRPREKLLAEGPGALSDGGLLALFLHVGAHGKTAVDLGNELIAHFGGLHPMLTAGTGELVKIKAIGLAKQVKLQAVFELVRRALHEKLQDKQTLDTPQLVSDFLSLWLAGKDYESFA